MFRFQKHAARVISKLSEWVGSLHDMEALVVSIKENARSHSKRGLDSTHYKEISGNGYIILCSYISYSRRLQTKNIHSSHWIFFNPSAGHQQPFWCPYSCSSSTTGLWSWLVTRQTCIIKSSIYGPSLSATSTNIRLCQLSGRSKTNIDVCRARPGTGQRMYATCMSMMMS